MGLRPFQADAIEKLRGGDLLVAPTGSGKTVMLAAYVARLVAAGRRVLWVAPRRELVGQASKALFREFLLPDVNVWVRTVQQIRAARDKGALHYDDLVFDEAHHLGGEDWSLLATEQCRGADLVGATATPERGDGTGLGEHFGRIVEAISIKDAIADGYLVPATTIRPEHPLDPGTVAQDPVKAYREHAPGQRAILFAPDVSTAIQYACDFRTDGWKSFAIWGDMPSDERKDKLESFERGEIDVLTSVNVLTEGFDVPATECVILARGFGSAGQYLQAVGRGLRPFPGKSGCTILDLRGTSHHHGEPDDIRSFHLEGKAIRRTSDDPNIRFCPVCGFPTVSAVCEQCAYCGEMRMRKPRVLGLPIDRFARFQLDKDPERAKYLARQLAECEQKGWKPGRAYIRYKAKYFTEPDFNVRRLAKEMIK